jgi:hypothetical protein
MKVHYKQRNVVDIIDDYIREAEISGRRVDYVELQDHEMEEFKRIDPGYASVDISFSNDSYLVYRGIRVYAD